MGGSVLPVLAVRGALFDDGRRRTNFAGTRTDVQVVDHLLEDDQSLSHSRVVGRGGGVASVDAVPTLRAKLYQGPSKLPDLRLLYVNSYVAKVRHGYSVSGSLGV